MIIGFIVVCGFTLGAPQTVEGCRPFIKLFKTTELCATAGEDAEYLDFGPGLSLAYSQCLTLGEAV